MIRVPAAALALLAVVAVAGCGQARAARDAGLAGVAADAPTRSVDPDTPVSNDGDQTGHETGKQTPSRHPVWPGLGCGSRSVVSIDYARMPAGHDTPFEAVEASPAPDLPDGVLTMAPDQGKGTAHVWILDPGTDGLRADVSVLRGPDGWFVDGVMTCS